MHSKLAPSKKEARRLLDQGAISINESRITDPNHEFVPLKDTVIKVGKRKFLKNYLIWFKYDLQSSTR